MLEPLLPSRVKSNGIHWTPRMSRSVHSGVLYHLCLQPQQDIGTLKWGPLSASSKSNLWLPSAKLLCGGFSAHVSPAWTLGTTNMLVSWSATGPHVCQSSADTWGRLSCGLL